MIFDLIIVSSLFLVIILIQFQIKQITKYKNGYILATSIPFDLIEDERIKEITEELKRENSILFKIFLPLPLLIFIAETELVKMLLFVFVITIYAILINIFTNKSMKELREYKKIKNIKSNIKYADLKANVEIKKNMPSKFMHILPMIILLPGLFFLDFEVKTSTLFLITGAILNLSLIYFAIVIEKSPNIIYSELEEVNVDLNVRNKGNFSKFILIFTLILSIINLIGTILSYNNPYSYLPFIVYIVFVTLGLIFIIIKQNNISKEKNINLNVDEKDYYDIFGYKNEDDKRILVPSKLSPGNMDINRGRPLGKAIFYGSIAIGILFRIFTIFLTPANYKYNFENDRILISAKLYKDEINYKDIEEVKILDEFPGKDVIRINGTSLKSQNYGSFSIKGIGNVRLYYYKSSKKVIFIRADKNYIFNQKTDRDTKELYEKIISMKFK